MPEYEALLPNFVLIAAIKENIWIAAWYLTCQSTINSDEDLQSYFDFIEVNIREHLSTADFNTLLKFAQVMPLPMPGHTLKHQGRHCKTAAF